MDAVALVPVVGGIKYVDEASAVIKSGAKYGDEAAETIKSGGKTYDIVKNKIHSLPKNPDSLKNKGWKENSKIHSGKQNKHIQDTNNYKQQVSNGKTPSILTENPNKLLKEGAGKGRMITSTKESVDFGRMIGKYYDVKTKKYYNTTRGTIHYDNKGNAHIVPARPINFNK